MARFPRRHRPSYRVQAATYGALSDGGNIDQLSASAGTLNSQYDSGASRNVIPPLRGASGSIGPSYTARPNQTFPNVAALNIGSGPERSGSPFGTSPSSNAFRHETSTPALPLGVHRSTSGTCRACTWQCL